jgi:hypothetical protein
MGCGATAPTDEIKEIPGGVVAIVEPDGFKKGPVSLNSRARTSSQSPRTAKASPPNRQISKPGTSPRAGATDQAKRVVADAQQVSAAPEPELSPAQSKISETETSPDSPPPHSGGESAIRTVSDEPPPSQKVEPSVISSDPIPPSEKVDESEKVAPEEAEFDEPPVGELTPRAADSAAPIDSEEEIVFEEPPIGNFTSRPFAGVAPITEVTLKEVAMLKYKFSDDEK